MIKGKIDTEKNVCDTHNKIGKIIRRAIKETGGTMPEDLTTPNKSLKEIEKGNTKFIQNK